MRLGVLPREMTDNQEAFGNAPPSQSQCFKKDREGNGQIPLLNLRIVSGFGNGQTALMPLRHHLRKS